jgi:4-amino-4-deoxy-L-arabinose transferase-like glycosyltransferase
MAALCLYHLDATPLWNDEAFSFFVANHDLPATLDFVRQDTQPPLYYLALSFWLRLGHDPWVLRSLSALAMVLCVPLLADAARRLLGWRVALLAALLFVVDVNCVDWAQKARPYALQTLFVALSFWGFARIWLGQRGRVGWLAYALGGGLAMLTQYPAGFFVLGCNIAMALRLLPSIRTGWGARRVLLGHWVLAQLLLIAVFATWLPGFLVQFSTHLLPEQIAARHPNFLIDGGTLFEMLRGLLSIPTLWRAQLPFTIVYAVVASAGAVAVARRNTGLPVGVVVAAPLAVCQLGFWLLHPVFGYVTYSFVWLLVPYSMLLAAGVALLRPRLLRAGVLALLLLGNAWGLRNYYGAANVPLDQVAAAIGGQLRPGDGVLLSSTLATRWGLAYYLGPPYAGRLAGLDVADAGAAGWPIRDRAQALRQPRLWLVQPDGEVPAVAPAELAPIMTRGFQQRFGGVLVERYDHAAAP